MDDAAPSTLSIVRHFQDLTDPRVLRTQEHKLIDIIIIAICGVICGADSWVQIEQFGKSKLEWFSNILALENGIPSHDTFGRVFAALSAAEFETAFRSWITQLIQFTQGQVIAIDGKTIRRSHNKGIGKEAIHMVSAWASDNHVVLGQLKVSTKSNEITAIPELLKLLNITDCTITIDAMGCQSAIAQKIIEGKGNYVLSVKENQEALYDGIKEAFASELKDKFKNVAHDYYETIEKSHGRVETRKYYTITESSYLTYLNPGNKWQNLAAIGMVEATRWIQGETSTERRYYILSCAQGAQYFANAVRAHWSIENSLHWMLDVIFSEDDSRIRTGDADQNFSMLRKIALMLLKRDSSKGGIQTKRLRAGWENDFLWKVLTG